MSSYRLSTQLDPKSFTRVIAFWFSSENHLSHEDLKNINSSHCEHGPENYWSAAVGSHEREGTAN